VHVATCRSTVQHAVRPTQRDYARSLLPYPGPNKSARLYVRCGTHFVTQSPPSYSSRGPESGSIPHLLLTARKTGVTKHPHQSRSSSLFLVRKQHKSKGSHSPRSVSRGHSFFFVGAVLSSSIITADSFCFDVTHGQSSELELSSFCRLRLRFHSIDWVLFGVYSSARLIEQECQAYPSGGLQIAEDGIIVVYTRIEQVLQYRLNIDQ
jgi:hypothetical protein